MDELRLFREALETIILRKSGLTYGTHTFNSAKDFDSAIHELWARGEKILSPMQDLNPTSPTFGQFNLRLDQLTLDTGLLQ